MQLEVAQAQSIGVQLAGEASVSCEALAARRRGHEEELVNA